MNRVKTFKRCAKIVVTMTVVLCATVYVPAQTQDSTLNDRRTTMTIPRPEYPRPQFQREQWINLNGPWSFGIDAAITDDLDSTIIVPFAPESRASGIEHRDFMESVCYRRVVQAPPEWQGKDIYLRFGAVDYQTEVLIDGERAGEHNGGSCSFSVNVTAALADDKPHTLTVHAIDKLRDGHQPSGKQSQQQGSYGCFYTRTTGIWQTVWMEAVDPAGLKQVQTIPDFDKGAFSFIPEFYMQNTSNTLRVTVTEPDTKTTITTTHAAANGVPVTVALQQPKPWAPGSPYLYDILFEVMDGNGKVLDSVKSYAGLRKVHTQDGRIYINNKPVYLRFVLDQGFYPDGVWTAPTDSDLENDIKLSMKAGFNGARLHQKIFEERFHYYADKLGYLTWAEMPSWGTSPGDKLGAANMINELRQAVVRDRNHPSIIAWTPWNEHEQGKDPVSYCNAVKATYDLCHDLDPTRPVNDSSGWSHVKTDLYTSHNYEQDADKLQAQMAMNDTPEKVFCNAPQNSIPWDGTVPYLLDEFGGIKWTDPGNRNTNEKAWGYGDGPKTIEEYYTRLAGLVRAIENNKHIAGWCFTQLTDVEQEQNGIYNYDRTAKFDMDKIRAIFQNRTAAK